VSRFKKTAAGALWAGFGFVAAALATLWATPRVLAGLGMESYGVLGLLLGLQGGLLMVLSNPGQLAALILLGGEAGPDLKRRSQAISAWSLLAAGAALALGWAFAAKPLAEILWQDPFLRIQWQQAVPYAGLGWAFQLLTQTLWSAQRARQRQALAEGQQALLWPIVILLAPLAVYQARGLQGVVEYQALAWMLALIVGLALERRQGGDLNWLPKDDRPSFAEIRRLAGWSLVALIGGAVLLYADRLFSLKAGARELAAWSVATAMSLRIAAGLGLLGPLLLPQLNELRQDPQRWGQMQSLYLRFSGLAALAFFLPLAAGGASLLGAWVGPEVEERARPWIVLLAFSGLGLCLSNATYSVLMGMDAAKSAASSAIGAALAGLGIGALAQHFGLPAAAWMALGGQTVAVLWRTWVLQRDGLKRPVLAGLLQSFFWVLPAAALLPLLRWALFPRWFGLSLMSQASAFGLAGAALFAAGLAFDHFLSLRRGRLSLWSQLRRLLPAKP
jgi:hypothetical protein